MLGHPPIGGQQQSRDFAAYVEGLAECDRVCVTGPPHCEIIALGLIMPCERKSVEPMAAVTALVIGRQRAPVAAAFCRPVALVRREGIGQGG